MKVNEFNVGRMRQQQAFEFYNKVIETSRISSVEDLHAYRNNLIKANDAFDIALKPILKSELTEDIAQEDAKRDNAWRGLNSAAQTAVKHYDPDIKAIAKRADIIVKTYGNPTKLAYTEETGTLRNLIADLKEKLSTAEHEKIGIKGWLAELDRANKEFAKMIAARQDKIAYRESGKSLEKRKEADEAYKSMVEFINAYVVLHPNDEIIDFIVQLNHMIDKEVTVMKNRATRSSSSQPVPSGDETETDE
ncbi:MAG: DUF6261 family protein [Tannerellaceae bacterium]|nr:DUF6261 family protein [Tannerellaceae bacterium]